ncbi:MAG TPA: DUF4282 domain-containing protein [Devosiaceae bacterium]|jgi:hypothetical protein
MTLDALKKLLTGKSLFRLDNILSPRLVPMLYLVGLAAILVWAVGHLFLSFGSNFGNGLWGLLEIVVYGLLAIIVLRIVCEALLVFFKSNEGSADTVARTRISASLLDEVRDAIHDLAEAEDLDYTEADEYLTPATDPTPTFDRPQPPVTDTEPVTPRPIRRTAKRSPPTPKDML